MSSSPSPTPPHNDDEIPVPRPAQSFSENPPLAPSFEDQLAVFWERNAKTIYTVIVIILAGILGKGGYDYFLKVKEEGIAREYNAATTNDQLRNFAGNYASHTLGGLASLRLADDAYSNGKYTDAIAHYERAVAALSQGPLGGRARLGAAVARLLAGQTADGEKALAALAADTTELKSIRAEAAYHLGSHQLSAGRTDEGNKSLEQAAAIDPTSVWSERALNRKSTSTPAS